MTSWWIEKKMCYPINRKKIWSKIANSSFNLFLILYIKRLSSFIASWPEFKNLLFLIIVS